VLAVGADHDLNLAQGKTMRGRSLPLNHRVAFTFLNELSFTSARLTIQ
jgi:hypothetical protein